MKFSLTFRLGIPSARKRNISWPSIPCRRKQVQHTNTSDHITGWLQQFRIKIVQLVNKSSLNMLLPFPLNTNSLMLVWHHVVPLRKNSSAECNFRNFYEGFSYAYESLHFIEVLLKDYLLYDLVLHNFCIVLYQVISLTLTAWKWCKGGDWKALSVCLSRCINVYFKVQPLDIFLLK